MKTKLLILYGYLIPFIASAVVSILPMATGLINAEDVAKLFFNKKELVFAILAVFGAVAIPFQNQILSESDEHVLIVLRKSRTRQVFWTASAIQAIIVILMSLALLFLTSISSHASVVGLLEAYAISLVSFEFIAMISNGRAYTEIREKIITRIALESFK